MSDVLEFLTCFYCLPSQGEGAAGLQAVGRDGAVIVSCRAPGECGCALSDFLHNHDPWGTGGTYRKGSG